jgi:N-acetyl-alpha-D-muramate 1-phosphate uridylyltransferase
MILAAGFGTRLRPLTDCTAKPLLQVAGKPLISYSLALLRAAGIHEVIINLHHRGDELRAALGNGAAYDMAITYSAENPILDTGGAIKKAQPFLRGGRFVVLNADIICDIDLQRLATWHGERGALATMVLRDDREVRPARDRRARPHSAFSRPAAHRR